MRSRRFLDFRDKPTAFRVFRSAALTLGGGSVKIAFDAVHSDPGGNYTIGLARYFCPVPGLYLFTTCMGTVPNSYAVQPSFYKNAAYFSGGAVYQPGASGGGGILSDVIPCKAGDYIEVYYWTGGAVNIAANPGGNTLYFAGGKIA